MIAFLDSAVYFTIYAALAFVVFDLIWRNLMFLEISMFFVSWGLTFLGAQKLIEHTENVDITGLLP